MTADDFRLTPVDPTSAQKLADGGLRMAIIDAEAAGHAEFDAWVQSGWRGFHSETISEEQLEAARLGTGYRRHVAVWDDAMPQPEIVGTVAGWTGELTVPGHTTLPAWAISAVSVAGTHSKRGIARVMLESELRTASALGVPMAMLTVSESTLYGRYGFAPAALAAYYTFEGRRARWIGPTPAGQVSFITPEQFREFAPPLFARVRLQSPGQMEMWGGRWDQFANLSPDQADRRKTLRAIRYLDADGELRGLATYRVTGGEPDFTKHKLEVGYLLTETPDAYAALWRFLLEQPLVETVVADLRSIDEPVHWMIADWRAATVETTDHLWLRVLDVAASFSARSYVTAGQLAVSVTDEFGYAAGDWLISVPEAGAQAQVTQVTSIPDGVPALALDVAALSALYLGGISATTLAAAQRLTEVTSGAAVEADTLLRSPQTPWLSVWF